MPELTDRNIQELSWKHDDYSSRFIVYIALLELQASLKDSPDKFREEYGSFFFEMLEDVNTKTA